MTDSVLNVSGCFVWLIVPAVLLAAHRSGTEGQHLEELAGSVPPAVGRVPQSHLSGGSRAGRPGEEGWPPKLWMGNPGGTEKQWHKYGELGGSGKKGNAEWIGAEKWPREGQDGIMWKPLFVWEQPFSLSLLVKKKQKAQLLAVLSLSSMCLLFAVEERRKTCAHRKSHTPSRCIEP